jgi:hypothetical protein
MQLSDDFVAKWEHIISSVQKTSVPIECIKKVIMKLDGRRRKTINFQTLKRQGLAIDEIEMLLNRQLEELGEEVIDLEFIVDVTAVAQIVQPETNRILNGL